MAATPKLLIQWSVWLPKYCYRAFQWYQRVAPPSEVTDPVDGIPITYSYGCPGIPIEYSYGTKGLPPTPSYGSSGKYSYRIFFWLPRYSYNVFLWLPKLPTP